MLHASFFRGLARYLQLVCLALAATTASVFAQTSQPTAADGYDPNVNGNIFVIATQGDGKQIIAGLFGNVAPNGGIAITRNNIARLNPDGSLDPAFDPETDGAVRAVAVQQDGRILIGGDFTHVGGVARSYIARLMPDGTVDTSFSPAIGTQISAYPGTTTIFRTTPQVFALALQADNSIVVGGTFGSATSTGSSTAVARFNMVKFDANGIVDPNYNPAPDAVVFALVRHIDNKIVVGGGFTTFQSPTPTTRLHMARLNPDGSVDSEFDPKPDNGVTCLAVQSDGKIVVGGYFLTLQPIGDTSADNRSHLARLNSDGTIDSEFYPVIGGDVFGVSVNRLDGSIYVGGTFAQAWGRGNKSASTPNVVRFFGDGTVDDTFSPGVNGEVDAFAFQPDGKVIVAGYFTRAQPAGLTTAVIRNHIARVLPSGELDSAFQLDPGGRILASIVQADGKIVVAGSFTNVGGVTRNFIARLNPDGSLDSAYNPNLNGRVYTMAYQNSNNENKILIGGTFTEVGTDTRNHIARLNPADGSVDSEFNPNLNGDVSNITVQKDGSILVGGSFSQAQPIGVTTAVDRLHMLKLTYSGQVDPNFDPSPDNNVMAMAVQSDGKIVIGGFFTSLSPGLTSTNTSITPTARNFIARLNTDGTIDTTYDPNASGAVLAIVLQSDGKTVVGGQFVDFFPNGTTTAVLRNYIARVNKDGTIDSAFDPHANGFVLTLALESNQQILAGGYFTTFTPNGADPDTGWILRKYFARLNTDGTVDNSLNLDLNEVPGNHVDSVFVLPDDSFLIGGTFTSLQPLNAPSRVDRTHFAHIMKDGSLDSTFNVGAGGSANPQTVIKAIALQTDGKIVLGGNFTDLGGAASVNLARYTPEGNPDLAFNSALTTDGQVNALGIRASGVVAATQFSGFAWLNPDGTLRPFTPSGANLSGQIYTAIVQSNGQLIIGGSFTDLSNTVQGNLLRFNTDGSVDTSFAPSVNGTVTSMLLQNDGKLLIVGSFTTVDTVTRQYIARLNNDGTLDTTFNPNPNGAVNAVAVTSDGHVILGGSFTSLTPNGTATSTTRDYIARVDSSGNVDTAYDPNLNGAVNDLLIQPSDGRVIAVGSFTTAQPNGATATTNVAFAARFNTDGTLDTTFEPTPNAPVLAVALQGGNVLLGGNFGSLQPVQGGNYTTIVTRLGFARVSATDGSVDTTFSPSANGAITSIVVEPSGSIILGGSFTAFLANNSKTPIARNHLVRVNPDGSLDAAFNPDVAGQVIGVSLAPDNSILVGGTFDSLQPTGMILVGGSFTEIGGVAQKNLGQLNADGSVNAGFQPNPDGAVNAVLPLPDGSYVVGGAFANIANQGRKGVARFLSNGTLDSFNPSVSGTVTAMALQVNSPTDIRVLVGANTLVRLNSDGSTDSTFTSAATFAPVTALAVQPDGRILVAGPATSGGAARILRLNSNGTVDSSFTTVSLAGPNDVQAMTLETDGGIIVAGSFTSIGGTSIKYLARLSPTGAVDPTFNPAPNGSVTAVALQSDGQLMLGGSFTSVGSAQRVNIARVSNTSSATETIAASTDGHTLTWLRSGTSGELAAATFDWSTDAQSWTPLGTATRVPGTSNWQLPNIYGLPASSPFYIRGRGIAYASAGQSTSSYETVRTIDFASPVAGITSIVGPTVTATSWDQTHYVWTVDPMTGLLRIVDVLSGVVLDASRTVVLGGSVKPATAASLVRLADLSTRGNVSPTTPLINGFAIAGTTPRSVLIRAVGPGLAGFHVDNYLKSPELLLYNSNGVVIASNQGWNNDPVLAAAFVQTGAFPFVPGSADAALLVTLSPGLYTVQVADAGAGSPGGDALVEVYDAGSLSDTNARLMNLSSRGTVPANGSLIGGLVISGNAPKTLLVRGIGPGLSKYGVTGVLNDPTIAVYDAQGNEMAGNDNWGTSADAATANADYAAAVSSAAVATGAFALDNGSKDAALVITLPAGAYTIQLTGVGGTSGAALIEVYELP